MGKWFLESIKVRHDRIDTAESFGTNIRVKFRMRYVPIAGQQFTETPQLIYYERIVMKTTQGLTQEYWDQSVDQYQRNPGGLTFQSWIRRYQAGYQWAATRTNTLARGRVRLLNPVGLRARPEIQGEGIDAEATASRDYLGRWGGILEIKVQDAASIGLTSMTWDRKERTIFFTIGVQGSTVWRRAKQYLLVDRTTAPVQRVERFEVRHSERAWGPPTWHEPVDTAGFTQVNVPANLTMNPPLLLVQGEYQ
jgi:hypothetical protein